MKDGDVGGDEVSDKGGYKGCCDEVCGEIYLISAPCLFLI